MLIIHVTKIKSIWIMTKINLLKIIKSRKSQTWESFFPISLLSLQLKQLKRTNYELQGTSGSLRGIR